MKALVDRNKFGPWAIVTGASSGIGKEFARHLAASGLNVVLVARRLVELEEVGRGLVADFSVQYRTVSVDLTEAGFLEKLEESTRDLDVGLFIGNAGTATPGKFLGVDCEEFLRCVQLKVVANLTLVHHFGRRLAKRGRGGVLLNSSIGGLQGVPYIANNAASEAYVLSLGEGLHSEFQELGLHMTVLMPGPTATPGQTRLGIDPANMRPAPMSAERVAAEGLAALNANRATHIAGRMNRIMFSLMSRSVATKMMGAMIAGRDLAASAGTRALAPPEAAGVEATHRHGGDR